MWHHLYRSADRLSHGMAVIAGFAVLLIAFMQMTEIIVRNIFDVSLTFVWEYAAYMHVSAIFFGLSFTLRTGGHIQVTLLSKVAPRLFHWVSTLLGLAISGFLSLALLQLCINWGVTGRSSGTVDDLPLVYPMACVTFGACMLTLQLVLRLLHLLLGTPVELAWAHSPSAD